MKSFAIPTQSQIDVAVQRMRSPEFAAYFFSRLENPNWVNALAQEDLFSDPPPPIHREDGGMSFPHWPASNYLARMAKHVPAEVAGILSDVQTENVFVVADIIHAAMAMPPADAAGLVPRIGEAARAGTLWIHLKDASDLCVHLASNGEVDAALALAHALFAPRPGEGEEQVSQRDEYWYKEGMRNVVPVLAVLRPKEFSRELCGWLNALVDAKEHAQRDSGHDSSYWWRPAVEEHEQNLRSDLTGTLVGFVRLGLEHAVREGGLSLEQALTIVSDYPYLIFRRMRVHLINEFAEQDTLLARQAIMDRETFDDFMYKHEYAMLVGRRLGLLTPEEREQWFAWVDAGPDMSEFDARFRETQGRDPTAEDRADRLRYWQFNKLHCVRTHLEGDRQAFYQGMLDNHGEPELADLNSRISTGWGSTSPITVGELSRMTFAKAVERVASWEPSEDQFRGPDSEGLATAFGEYVGTKPEEFSAEASTLVERPAIYIRAFISQMIAAIELDRAIDILAVLSLCEWVLGRPMGESTRVPERPGGLVDRDWRWTRDEISRFARSVCEAKAEDDPRYALEALREPIWSVVKALSHGPTESYILQDEAKFDPRLHDYLTEGMNSPRGKAVGAAFAYARWVANHVKETDGQRELIPEGFTAMPEVRELLEWLMAPENRDVGPHAVIGSQINLINWIDKEWLERHSARLFDLGGLEHVPPEPEGWAAWNAFLVWVSPHSAFYRLFEQQFAYSVAQSALVQSEGRSRESPMERLGEHLVVLYGRAELDLSEDDGILKRFLSGAFPEYRRHAIGFVGRVLEFEKDLPQSFVDRYQALWEVYWAGAGKADAGGDPDGMLFGQWFTSGRFPPEWALARLQEFVDVVSVPEPDHAVVEQLAEVAPTDAAKAVYILNRMVHGDREGWRVGSWIESARTVLQTGIQAGGEPKIEAERLINYLGRRGFTELGDLL